MTGDHPKCRRVSYNAGRFVKAKWGMPGQGDEICVSMEQVPVGPDRDSCDQTIDELANSLALSTTYPVQRRRMVIISRRCRNNRRSTKQTSQLSQMVLVPSAGQYLHRNRITDTKVRIEQIIDSNADRRTCVA